MATTPQNTHVDAPPRPNLVLRISAVLIAASLIWLSLPLINNALGLEGEGGGDLAHWVNALVAFSLAVPMVWLARRYLDRRPWSGLGLSGPREAWRPLLLGVLAWTLPAAVGLALALALGVSITPNAPPGEMVLTVLVLVLLVLVYEAVPEELIFRGYLYRNLNTAMSAWLTVVVQAALFTLFGTALWVVISGWDVLGERLPLFFGMGLVMGCIRLVTGSVWACVGFHLAFQVVAQALLGGNLFVVDDAATATGTVLLLPLVLGVSVTMALSRKTGNWSDRIPDPAGAGRAD